MSDPSTTTTTTTTTTPTTPDGYLLIPRKLAVGLTVVGVYVAIALTVLVIAVFNGLGTNTSQSNEIRDLVTSNRAAGFRGCESNNDLRRQSNLRIPLERIELNTALTVAVLAHRFDLEVPAAPLSPAEVQEQRGKLQRVALRNCGREYGPPAPAPDDR